MTEPAPKTASPTAGVEFKAALLVLALAAMVIGSGVYLLYARGAFEATQTLVLVADDSEGVSVGMDLTFSGFPIGRVQRIELGDDGSARVLVDVPRKDAHWLRESSIFTMERSLVGTTRIRAYTGMLDSPLLADGAERPVLKGDAMAEIPRMVSSVRDLLENLDRMTSEGSPLNASLRQLEQAMQRLNGRGGALDVMVGNPADRERLLKVFDDARQVMRRLDGVAQRTEQVIQQADQRVFGQAGLMDDTQAAVREMQRLLADARQTLQKVDGVLVEAQGIAANTRSATVDLDALRADVEASLRKVDGLITDVQKRWPFSSDTTLRLP